MFCKWLYYLLIYLFKMAKAKAGRSKELQVATRDYTLNMHKRL